jgi:hypothetical protein
MVLALLIAGALIWLQAEQGEVELSALAWDCTGTDLVAGPGAERGSFAEQPLAPELVPGMSCWASWQLGSSAAVSVVVKSFHFDYGGPATGGAFRITGAQVDGNDAKLTSPPPPDGYDIQIPVGRRLSKGEQVEVGVLVVFGEGCSADETRFTMYPTVKTTAWAFPRTTTHRNDSDEIGSVSVPRGLTLFGTPDSACTAEPGR